MKVAVTGEIDLVLRYNLSRFYFLPEAWLDNFDVRQLFIQRDTRIAVVDGDGSLLERRGLWSKVDFTNCPNPPPGVHRAVYLEHGDEYELIALAQDGVRVVMAPPHLATDRMISQANALNLRVHLLGIDYPKAPYTIEKRHPHRIYSLSTDVPLRYGTSGVMLHPVDATEIALPPVRSDRFPGITGWNVRCMVAWGQGRELEAPIFL